MPPAHIGVVGASRASARECELAEAVGRTLAERRMVVVCGGLGGVMEAACRGAKARAGTTVGILPGAQRSDANAWVDVAIATGLGEARNSIVARTVDAIIAVGGEYGTLSELAFALAGGKPVVGLETWKLLRAGRPEKSIVCTQSPEEAVRTVSRLIGAAN